MIPVPWWRPVPIKGYEAVYEVSYDGKVRSIRAGKIMATYIAGWGMNYEYVDLSYKGKRKKCRVHRLVALAFIPNPYRKSQVNHKDFNTLNNHGDNLEWMTDQENSMYNYFMTAHEGIDWDDTVAVGE